MAARINKKFVLVFGFSVVVVVGALAGLVYLQREGAPERNAAAGDDFMKRAEYENAMNSYGKALAKRPNNVAYIDKYESALVHVVPRNQMAARSQLSDLLRVRAMRVKAGPRTGSSYVPLLEMTYDIARSSAGSRGWEDLEKLAEEMTGRVPKDDPDYAIGRVYWAIGKLQRPELLKSGEFDAITAELKTIVTAQPKLDLAWGALLDGLRVESERRRVTGNTEAAAKLLAEFQQQLAAALVAAPEGPRVRLTSLLDLLMKTIAASSTPGAPAVPAAQLQERIEQVAEAAIGLQNSLDMIAASIAMSAAHPPDSVHRTIEVLEEWLKSRPDELGVQLILAIQLLQADELQRAADAHANGATAPDRPDYAKRAAEVARMIIDHPPLTVGLLAVGQQQFKAEASKVLLDRELRDIDFGKRDDLEQRLKRADAIVDEMAKYIDAPESDPIMLVARGRLAALRNKPSEASAKFEKALAAQGAEDRRDYNDTLIYAAMARYQLHESGKALEYAEKAIMRNTRDFGARLIRFDVLVDLGRIDQATAELAKIRELAPGSDRLAKAEARLADAGQRSVEPGSDADIVARAQQAWRIGERDKAVGLLAGAIAKDPKRIVLHRQLAVLQFQSGETEEAKRAIDAGLAVDPNDDLLTKLKGGMSSGDPYDQVAAVINATPGDPKDQAVMLYTTLRSMATSSTLAAEKATKAGQPDEAKRSQALADQQNAAADKALAEAKRVAPGHPELLSVLFTEAFARSPDRGVQIANAEAVVKLAEESTDPIRASLLRVRFLLLRREGDDVRTAVASLASMCGTGTAPTEAYRLLGQANELLGNMPAAIAAYKTAYGNQPNDQNTVQLYAGALNRSGDRTGALEVLAEAAKLPNASRRVRNLWLTQEADIGDQYRAAHERIDIAKSEPDDIANKVALAELIARLSPRREDIRDARGRETFTTEQWKNLDPAKQQSEISKVSQQWWQQAQTLLNEVAATDPSNVELVTIRAAMLRDRGRNDEAEKVIQDLIDRAGSNVTAPMWLAMGDHLLAVERDGQNADNAYSKAASLQTPKHEIDRLVGERFLARNYFDRALPYLESARQGGDDRTLWIEIAQARQGVRKLDEAKQAVDEAVKLGGDDVGTLGQKAAIILQQALNMVIDAKPTDDLPAIRAQALKLVPGARELLEQAKDLDPQNPGLLCDLARAHIVEYKLDNSHTAAIDQALKNVNDAIKIRPSDAVASGMKIDLLRGKGELTAAITEARRFLELVPAEVEARRRLIDLLSTSRDWPAADEIAREGVIRFPNDPQWNVARGELAFNQGRFLEAGQFYDAAWRIRHDEATLNRMVDLFQQDGKVASHRRVAELLEADDTAAMVARSPFLVSARGASRCITGNRKSGLEDLKDAYRMAREGVAATPTKPAKFTPQIFDLWFREVGRAFESKPGEGPRVADAEPFIVATVGGTLSSTEKGLLGEMYLRSGSGGWDRAEQLLDDAVKDDSLLASFKSRFHMSRSNLYWSRGQAERDRDKRQALFAKSADAVEAAVNAGIGAVDPSALNNLAFMRAVVLGQPERAVEFAERAVRSAPNRPEFRDTLGVTLLKLNRTSEAIEQLLKAWSLRQIPDTGVHLAEAYVQAGDTRSATTYLDAAEKLIKPAEGNRDVEDRIKELREQIRTRKPS